MDRRLGFTNVQIWDLFENQHLFDGIDPERKKYSNRQHLAEMVAYLGPPPKELLSESRESSRYFDADGGWLVSTKPVIKYEGADDLLRQVT